MKKLFLLIAMATAMMSFAQDSLLVRIAEIEVHEQYLNEYLAAAHDVGSESVAKESGVICIFPMQVKEQPYTIRIVEIYRDEAAYQSHLQSPHFLKYKQGTLHMVKSLRLVDTNPLAPEDMELIFRKLTKWPIGEPNTGYAQYFVGNSYLAPMGAVTNVTFEPRCRNNWHIHHGAVQVLICVYGHGWYQEWGKPAVELREGVVIEIPEDVKHWHGAAKDSWMQHLTYHKDAQPDASNEWLEPVADEQYNAVQ